MFDEFEAGTIENEQGRIFTRPVVQARRCS
jgi:hypothetical protein